MGIALYLEGTEEFYIQFISREHQTEKNVSVV